MTEWSLNEIAALSRKAARGAGLPWGLAEEAGDAVRWLEARELPGARALLNLLARGDGNWPGIPTRTADGWHAAGGFICPILLGAAISDDRALLRDFHADAVMEPLLLLPFLGTCDGARLQWAGAMAVVQCGKTRVRGDPIHGLPTTVRLARRPRRLPSAPIRTRARVAPGTVAGLERFAARTYAPATAESRAGAGGGDPND